jgi:hypothetical protein
MTKPFQQIYREQYAEAFPEHPNETRLMFTPWLLKAVEVYAEQRVKEALEKEKNGKTSIIPEQW